MSVNPASKSLPANDLQLLSGKQLRAHARQGTLVVIPRNCTGCRTCELACSFAHSSQAADGTASMGKSRIRIHPAGPERFVQITCLQCVKAGRDHVPDKLRMAIPEHPEDLSE